MKDIFEVIKAGDLHEVKEIVFANPEIVFQKNQEGKTPWQMAFEASNWKMATFLKVTEGKLTHDKPLGKIDTENLRPRYSLLVFFESLMKYALLLFKILLLVVVFTALFYFTRLYLENNLLLSMEKKKSQTSGQSSPGVRPESPREAPALSFPHSK